MLIDTGQQNAGVMSCLGKHLPFWDRKIEVVMVSHPQIDHMGDLSAVVNRYKVGLLITNGRWPQAPETKQIIEMAKRKAIKWQVVRFGDAFRYSDLYFDIIWPKVSDEEMADATIDENHFAITTLLKYANFKALFTADIGEVEELAMADLGVLTKVDVLKVAHHGSKYSSSEKFVEAVKPVWAVISVGKKNRYGHPGTETLRRFEVVGSGIWRTDNQGEVEFVSDGKSFWRK